MTRRLARAVVRTSAWLAPSSLRARWREEWLAEIETAHPDHVTLVRVVGAPWDALSAHWTSRDPADRPRLWRGSNEWHQALRGLRRSPWYALTSIGVIALSLTFAVTIFAIVDGVLFRALPYPQPDRLFTVIENDAPVIHKPDAAAPSAVLIEAWRASMPSVQVAAYRAFRSPSFRLKSGAYAEELTEASVGRGFFETLGVAPLIGAFAPEDFTASSRVEPAILSYGFWQRWFGGDPAAVGRSVVGPDGTGLRVVGVMPNGFITPWGFTTDIITPLLYDRMRNGYERTTGDVLVRLPDEMTPAEAASRLSAIDATLAATWPAPSSPAPFVQARFLPIGAVSLTSLRSALTDASRATSWLVFGAVLTLMMLGCLNVGGLAAARVQDRWRDLVLRRALGAGAWDLVRLLTLETTIVVFVGTAVGVAMAEPLLRFTLRLTPDPVQFLKVPVIDARVIGFSALTSMICVALITLAAARALLRAPTARPVLADGMTMTRQRRWWSWSIVSAQVGLALVVTVGGALVVGSLLRVWDEDPGFDLSRTVRIRINPAPGATAVDIERLMADLRRQPGVLRAGGVAASVLNGRLSYGSAFDAPAPIPPPPPGLSAGEIGVLASDMAITRGYFDAAGLRLVVGRLPTEAEFDSGARVLVVSEAIARGYWPGQRAIGQTLVSNEYPMATGQHFTVVGVVSDARYASLDRDPIGVLYFPNAANPRPWLGSVLVQLSDHGPASAAGIEAWLRRRCPACTIWGHARTLDDLASATVLPRTFHAWLFASFGIAALIIVGIGILGLVAMSTSRRTKEFGIRFALGATPEEVVAQVVREQVGAVLLGLAMGGLAAAWAVRFLKVYLYKLPSYEPFAWAFAIGILLLVALAGAVIPSWRVSRIDPVKVLRAE
jgi:putative ABC transport system permease protein